MKKVLLSSLGAVFDTGRRLESKKSKQTDKTEEHPVYHLLRLVLTPLVVKKYNYKLKVIEADMKLCLLASITIVVMKSSDKEEM